MSLEVAAKHLAAHGRHGDSTLVHMNHKEVAGLQALARSKGKSLTINPRTGLPEAFNLRQELSNVTSGIAAPALGAALVYFSGGVIDPVTAGYIVGGTNYVATGGKDPTRSAMSGLGAYGGGSMAGNVMPSGTEAIDAEAAAAASSGGAGTAEALEAGRVAAENAPWYDKLAAGAQAAWNSPSTIDALGGYKVLGAAALPGIMDAARPKALPTTAQKPQMIRPYKFDYNAQNPNNPLNASYVPGQDTSERKWFTPTMVPQTPYQAADGGIIALAGGGMPVEQMSNNAAMGANTMYPMANTATSSFATPYQAPQSTNMLANMVAPSGGGAVGAMSGEPNMQGTRLAGGGVTGTGGLDLHIPINLGNNATGATGNNSNYPFQSNNTAVQTLNPFKSNITQSNMGFNGLNGPDGLSSLITKNGGPTSVNPMADDSGMHANDSTFSDTFQPQGTRAFNGNPQQMMGLLSSLMQGKPAGNSSAQMASGGMASGGISDAGYNLGGYSDGGRLLRGPGDGVSDSIPAQIGNKQPARLADGEFVIPARIVSELGNGSTEAGAKQLYKMLDRVQQARSKTTGKNKVAKNTNAAKLLPA